MNKELYLKFIELEKEDEKIRLNLRGLYDLLQFEDFFKTSKSKEALTKIKDYIKMLERKNNSNKRNLLKTRFELYDTCNHEIIITTPCEISCAICERTFVKEEEIGKLILEFKHNYIEENIINTIYETIEYLIKNNLDILNNFEALFKDKTLKLKENDKTYIKENCTLRRKI